MKSLFSRLRQKKGEESITPARPSSSASLRKDQTSRLSFISRHSSSNNAPSGISRSESPIDPLHSKVSSSASISIRPHSIIESDESGRTTPDIVDPDDTIRAESIANDDIQIKKVTFQSPARTLATTSVLNAISPSSKTTISPDSLSKPLPPSPPRSRPESPARTASIPPQSESTQPRSTSRQSLTNNLKKALKRHASLQVPSPYEDGVTAPSVSPAPSEKSLASMGNGKYLPQHNSWSEMAEEDLIAHLGPKERTRQEVLWEIVSSEERYVQELIKLNETFCRPLLTSSALAQSSRPVPTPDVSRTVSPALSVDAPSSITDYFGDLPIASQHSQSRVTIPDPRSNAYAILTSGRTGQGDSLASRDGLPAPRSHRSLPPFSRATSTAGSSIHKGIPSRSDARRSNSRIASFGSVKSVQPEVRLPESLETALSVLANGILEGHVKLAAALRKRYENQYPLVRSLADIFTAHSYILREYATYVLHLDKALGHVDAALTACTSAPGKRASRRLDETDLGRLGKLLLELEEQAAEKGEAGLAISLSKPFQRLLKYPLLFQNLLYNTDPSLKEYEATLAMVDEVETIVRSIENEKASFEEREKTRDVWARIEGVDQDRMIVAPKADRLLVSETRVSHQDADQHNEETMNKHKKSFRRLSDMLRGIEAPDLWIVRFTDVSLLCERTGMTKLPMSSNYGSTKPSSITHGRARRSVVEKRHGSIKARNLYRFVRVHEWHLESTNEIVSAPQMRQNEIISGHKPDTGGDKELPAFPEPKVALVQDASSPEPYQQLDQGPARVEVQAGTVCHLAELGDDDVEATKSMRIPATSLALGSDQPRQTTQRVRPSAPPMLQSRPPPASRALSNVNPSTSVAGRAARRNVSGDAATAKFANRLRSAGTEAPKKDLAVPLVSRTRKSLPATTAASRSRTSLALIPADANAPRPVSIASSSNRKTPSQTPPNRESAKAVSRTSRLETSVTGAGKRYVPVKASAIRPSPSTDSGVASMWTSYRDGGAVGTPRGPASSWEKHYGGRI